MIIAAAKGLIALLFRLSGIPWLIREFFCRNKISIILYHNPSPEVLDKHLSYLSKHYNFITLRHLVESIYEGDWSTVPPKSLVINLDDGYAGNYRLLGIFKRFGVVPTIYLCSHILGTDYVLQGDVLRRLPADILKGVENQRQLSVLEGEAGLTLESENPDRRFLSKKQIAKMAQWVDFQSHSRYHLRLTTCDDEIASEEISASKTAIEELVEKPCEHFSYPFGDYNERIIAYTKENGYRSGRTTKGGWNGPGTDPFRLKLTADIPEDASISVLSAHVSGLPRYTKRIAYVIKRRCKRWF